MLNTFTFDNYVSKVGSKKWLSSYCQSALSEVNDGMGIINTIPNVSGAMFVNPNANAILDDENWLSMRLCGDWTFYLSLLCGGKISYSVDTHSYYRFHEASTAKAVQATDNYFIEHCKVAKLVCDLYDIDDEVINKHYKVLKAEHGYMATKPSKSFE